MTTTAPENSPASFTHSNSEAGTSPPFEDSEASQIIRVKTALASARQILVISGAGISAESDIPTFRSKGGWWKSHDPQKLATRAAFERNPREVWEWYDYRRGLLAAARPNRAHEAIAEWERAGKQVFIITQNVDDLHEQAGSSQVVHIHGSIWQVRCFREGGVREDRRVPLGELPPRCSCGELLRPNVVWFDEALPVEERKRVKSYFKETKVDLALVIGTQATFDYIRRYAMCARSRGALLVEINPERTALTDSVDIHLQGKAGEILPLLT